MSRSTQNRFKSSDLQRGSRMREGLERGIRRRTAAKGELELPCIPAQVDGYVEQLLALWAALGSAFSPGETAALRALLLHGLEQAYASSTQARVLVQYEARSQPKHRLDYHVLIRRETPAQHYANWVSQRPPPLFGKLLDCKVIHVAAGLGAALDVPVLDVGAGTGRNAIPLLRRGHPTTALEQVPELVAQLRAAPEAAALQVVEADLFSEQLVFPRRDYRLAVMAEVTSDLRGVDQLRQALAIVADALAPGGLLVTNAFLLRKGYQTNAAARQAAQTALSTFYTREEFAGVLREVALEWVSDESMHDYERAHLPAEEWPPTGWFVDWVTGRNVFEIPERETPIEMRWIVLRRL